LLEVIFVGIADLFLYNWLAEKWTPYNLDFLDYLEARLENGPHEHWFKAVEQEFRTIWNIPPDTHNSHPRSRDPRHQPSTGHQRGQKQRRRGMEKS